MYKCLECGNIFDEGEQVEWNERHGLDTPPYEHFSGCPICNGEYEETRSCKHCRAEFLPDEMHSGLCDECLDEYRFCFEYCEKIGAECKTEIEINSLYTTLLTEFQIEEILHKTLSESNKLIKIDCKQFIEDDKDWFASKVIENEAE